METLYPTKPELSYCIFWREDRRNRKPAECLCFKLLWRRERLLMLISLLSASFLLSSLLTWLPTASALVTLCDCCHFHALAKINSIRKSVFRQCVSKQLSWSLINDISAICFCPCLYRNYVKEKKTNGRRKRIEFLSV